MNIRQLFELSQKAFAPYQEMIKSVASSTKDLSERVYRASVECSQELGGCPDLFYALCNGLLNVATMMDRLDRVVNHPDVGKVYSWLHPVKRFRAIERTRFAQRMINYMLSSLLFDTTFGKMRVLVEEARSVDVREGVRYVMDRMRETANERDDRSGSSAMAVSELQRSNAREWMAYTKAVINKGETIKNEFEETWLWPAICARAQQPSYRATRPEFNGIEARLRDQE